MPNIAKAQAEALGSLGDIGENKSLYTPVRLTVSERVLAEYGAEFKLKVVDLLNKKQNIGSGQLADSIDPLIKSGNGETILQIRLNDYYDFPNEGVKGVKSSDNAPNSPYRYRNLRVSKPMFASLKRYIQSGKAKVSSVQKDKAYGIGLEGKGKRMIERNKRSLIDQQTYTLGYLIKAYGIKASHYFTEAFDEVFKDFEPIMAEAVGSDIIVSLQKINLGKK